MTVIKIENLWKQYRLGVIGHGTLQADLQSWWARKWGKEDPNTKIVAMYKGQEQQVEGDKFWALRDINLEVQQGEILGIIGKNGAGKSTLLKILSRVTAPTMGEVKVKGRIASLLEVGTGFHPELTGRENIFLNGAILGMTKVEIKSKLDEIVDFSGVEQFIDTPVKRYSSGMYVRLAFAVAAHLDPEILVVDEVLAVGDAEFQRKCLGKMKEVSSGGRTILFVSHNMDSIMSLCPRSIHIEAGQIANDGQTNIIISKYLQYDLVEDAQVGSAEIAKRVQCNTRIRPLELRRISLVGRDGAVRNRFDSDEEIGVQLQFECLDLIRNLWLAVSVVDEKGVELMMTTNRDDPEVNRLYPTYVPGMYDVQMWFPGNTFGGRRHFLTIQLISAKEAHLTLERVLSFNVRFKGYGDSPGCSERGQFFRPFIKWQLQRAT